MKLESARALKAQLFAQDLKPLLAPKIANFSLAAGALGTVSKVHATIALGIAPGKKDGFRLAVRLQDRAMEKSAWLERVRARAKGEVDVRFVGWIDKQVVPWHQRRCRPLRIGCSLGHLRITAGTLGCFVKTHGSEKVYVLSNNHVLANENNASVGDAVLQPGSYDGGTPARDRVARLAKFVRLKTTGANLVDAAIARVDSGIRANLHDIRGLGALSGAASTPLDIGERVSKLGRTTGLTHGRVTAFDLDNLVVGYDIGALRFDDQIEIEGAGANPFSRGGDSGSIVVNRRREAVALLFAGGDSGGTNGMGLTYASPIASVLRALRVTIL